MTLRNRILRSPAASRWRRASDFVLAASAYACLLYVGACSLEAVLGALIDEPQLRAMIEHWGDGLLAPTCVLGRGLRQLLGGK